MFGWFKESKKESIEDVFCKEVENIQSKTNEISSKYSKGYYHLPEVFEIRDHGGFKEYRVYKNNGRIGYHDTAYMWIREPLYTILCEIVSNRKNFIYESVTTEHDKALLCSTEYIITDIEKSIVFKFTEHNKEIVMMTDNLSWLSDEEFKWIRFEVEKHIYSLGNRKEALKKLRQRKQLAKSYGVVPC